ncbi:hypothetical protein A3A75_05120 [Candidatus Woesebacteria bacterium RIFCSPLOWO2_01_FULL_39_10]|uniref:DUF5652 domain-containing protein n=1 Tax=Candidatus Woesebacteria bacterium RIFCSPLOWO2_01_FULL_39_10 TaxID=1802516 RepID=A0A1F8B4Z6_9BACT|nr:MAG: hypothetical protein A3A75_05120 [Candidatus Woesebacteria bacterium RIFCSPLOWO2_01_FULL_39_10]
MGGPGNWGFPNHWWGLILPFALIDLVLKGFALYRSARSGQKWWFVVLLLVNSLGILPGLYLLTHPYSKKSK